MGAHPIIRIWRRTDRGKNDKPEEIVSKLRQVGREFERAAAIGLDPKQRDVLMGQGMARLDAIGELSVTEQAYYRWRRQ